MDAASIRKVAARVAGETAFAELTREEDNSLDQVLLHKAASAEDRPLFEIAMRLPGDAVNNYEALGGTFKKQAFGQPMFSPAPAPDPKLEAASLKPPSASSGGSSGPTRPSTSSGSQGSAPSSDAGGPKVQSMPEPSVSGAGVSAGAGGGMG